MLYSPRIPVYVKKIVWLTPSVKQFFLFPLNGKTLPPFGGGAHITTYIRTHESELSRSYSLCGNPNETKYYQIAVKKQPDSKGGSLFWHSRIREGTKLDISFPKNDFSLSFKARHHMIYAAGIGITPFIPMMIQLQEKGKSFELHYASPAKNDCAFYDWLRSAFSAKVHFYFSKEDNRMTPELMADQFVGTHVYFCGPQSMVNAFAEKAREYGYPKGSIHFELFSMTPNQSAAPFEAILQRSGRVLQVPKEKSLLDALLEAGVKAPYSCKVGRCGTCALNVLNGKIDHQDAFLNEQEKSGENVILPCVSRCKTKQLVLDI